MKRTGGVFIGLLFLLCTGCARRDWTTDLLVFTDVTGVWDGAVFPGGSGQCLGGYNRAERG